MRQKVDKQQIQQRTSTIFRRPRTKYSHHCDMAPSIYASLLQTFGRRFWAGYQSRRKACIYKDNIDTEMDRTNFHFWSRIRTHGINVRVFGGSTSFKQRGYYTWWVGSKQALRNGHKFYTSNAKTTKIIFTCTILNGNMDPQLKIQCRHRRQPPASSNDWVWNPQSSAEVVWDVGDNVPNPVLQFFHCARFCPVHLLLCPAIQEKIPGREIWTSCRPFVKSSSSQPTSRKRLIQPGTQARCKVWLCAIVHENKFIDIFPAR